MSEPLKSLSLNLPLKTISELNARDHWKAKFRRKCEQQKEVRAEWLKAVKGRSISLPCVVKLVRVAPKLLDEGDNLGACFKGVRDEIARLLGVDDSPTSPVKFAYEQRAIGRHEYHVKIEVTSL